MKILKKKNIPFVIFLITALLVCAFAIGFSVKDIQHSSYLEKAKNLNVVMTKIGDHLNIAFESKWNKARFLSKRIERLHINSSDELTHELNDIYIETGEDFKVIDCDGIAYYQDGRQEYWKDHRAVPLQAKTFILSPLQFGITNENYMKYIVPLKEPLIIGETKILYTVLTEPLSALQKEFDTSNYGEGCLSFIIDKSGTYIYENGTDDLMADCYNFLAYVEKNVKFQYGESFEKFKENIQNGVSNTVLVEYNGSYYYLSHFDLDMESWTSIMLVPEKNTQAEAKSFTQKLLSSTAVIFCSALILFAIGFIYMWKKTVTKQRMATQAEKLSNEAKTNFLSSMSHDIRTPMNAIIGMTEIALHNKEDIPKSVQDNLEKIKLSSTHLLMLINDILDISKIESGKMSLNIAEFSIVTAINTLANLIRPLAKEKNIDLRIHTYNYRQEYVLGDELRISQVCINLATNAIKYTPNGGKVVIDFIQESVENVPNKVKMTFICRDTGIGMSKEYQKIMYDTFTRATDSRVNKVLGSGLGLPICKKMVQMMNGTLECESELQKGTKFTASFLLEKGKPDEIYEFKDLNILVVDHDSVSTEALSKIFQRLNIVSDTINDPSMLNSVLEQHHTYQAAFVELGVPDNKGLETVKTLRNRFGADFPVILTDVADMAEYSEIIEAEDIYATMNKPYFYRTVYRQITKVIKNKNADISIQEKKENQSLVKMNVLVAEDNNLNWEIIYTLLKINGINAQRATNGRNCINMLNNSVPNQYSAVLMDIRMPIMDGLESTRIIRKSRIDWIRNIPIIAMTADAFTEDIQQCLEAGMNSHLAKPIKTDRLISVLSDISNKH